MDSIFLFILFIITILFGIKKAGDYFDSCKNNLHQPNCLNDWDDIEYDDQATDKEDI